MGVQAHQSLHSSMKSLIIVLVLSLAMASVLAKKGKGGGGSKGKGRRPWLLWRLVPTMLRPELRKEKVKAKEKEKERERVKKKSAPLWMKLWTGQQRNMQERSVSSQSWGGWTMISTLMMNSLKQTLTLFQVRLQSL